MARQDDVSFGPGLAHRVVRVFILLMVVVTLMSLGGEMGWLFDLTTNFRPHYVLILTPLVIVAFLVGAWKVGLLGLAALAVHASFIVPELRAEPPVATGNGPTLNLFYANVRAENLRTDGVLQQLGTLKPDVAVLLEINERWKAELETLKGTFPHQTFRAREDRFGLAVLSKDPLVEIEDLTLGGVETPALRVELELGERRIEMWVVHAMPPGGPALQRQRDRQLADLGDKTLGEQGPVIVVGDLNVSPWSPSFLALLERAGLRDTRLGFGIQATWPALMGSLGVPIDHVLIRGPLEVRSRTIGDAVGSDHRPISIVLADGSAG